jgi:hypothetical protein
VIGHRARALALLTAVALSMSAVAACGGGGEEAQNAGSTDGGSSADSAVGPPDTLPLGPDVATTAVPGSTAPPAVDATSTSLPPRPSVAPSTARPTATPAPRGPLPTKPAAVPPTSAARPPQTPEQARWCPVAVESWRILRDLQSLTPADFGRIPQMLEIGRRSVELAPAEIRPAMEVVLQAATAVADAVVAGQVRVDDPNALRAVIDQKLGPGAYDWTDASLKAALQYGLNVC